MVCFGLVLLYKLDLVERMDFLFDGDDGVDVLVCLCDVPAFLFVCRDDNDYYSFKSLKDVRFAFRARVYFTSNKVAD